VRVLINVILFTADLFLCTLLSIYVLGIPLESPVTELYVVALVVLGNVAFLLYDRLLAMLTNLYVRRLRPKLFPFRH
jgi:biotin transporter BioY